MTTAYNLRNCMHRSSQAGRSERLDPGAGGVVAVSPVDRAVVVMTGAGARTLEAATSLGLGTSILCISQTAGVVIEGDSIAAGEFVKYEVTRDAAGLNQWVQTASTAITQQA